MAGSLSDLHESELALQARLRGRGELGLLMRGLSDLGPGWFTAAVVALLLFAVDPRLSVRLAICLLIALWLREVLALGMHSPRPYWLDADLLVRRAVPRRPSFGLPSGHALTGVVFWFYLAAESRRKWAWAVAGVIAFLIGLSRVYLGVHFISDVVLGWALGALYLVLYRRLEPLVAAWCSRVRPSVWALSALGCGVAMVLTGYFVRAGLPPVPSDLGWAHYAHDARRLGGVASLAGGVAGVAMGVWHLGGWSDPHGPMWLRIARVAMAGVVVRFLADPAASLILEWIARFTFEWVRVSGTFLVNACKYWFVWAFLPWCFVRLRWTRRMPLRVPARAS
jgi:membrane-associated phospholipid phosphatase